MDAVSALPALASCTRKTIARRIASAIAYFGIGAVLLSAFYFSPWWIASWVYLAILLGWAAVGVRIDPLGFIRSSAVAVGRVGRVLQRWPILALSMLMLSPLIAW